jgi:hypothetical protein
MSLARPAEALAALDCAIRQQAGYRSNPVDF